jgi:hypothetical protein
MNDLVIRQRRRRVRRPARNGPMRLHIVSFRFAPEGQFRRASTVLIYGRMDQAAAMKLAAVEAGIQGPEPWLTGINTVPPLRATPALDRICRQHTASATFLALLTQPAGYRPSLRLDLMGRDGVVLARAYDRVQAMWGDPRRALVWPRHAQDGRHA